MDTQKEVIDFLARAGSHGLDVRHVERIETHGAYIFLAGDVVFKLKRAVRYPYLDFSTLAKREDVCRREVRLNRRTAPDLYLGMVAITREANGELAIDGDGETVEWAVKMRRFPSDALFDHMAGAGLISFELCRRLARKIADFHQSAERARQGVTNAATLSQREIMEGNIAAFRESPELFPEPAVAALEHALFEHLSAQAALLDRRRADGYVRHCHGDLHLRNICLFDGEPTLFDCLEFDDGLATIDVLYDLAFLLMDMDEHGLAQEANAVLNHYVEITGEDDGLACLPLFLAQRAAIRAKVAADARALADDPDRRVALAREATGYLEAALAYSRHAQPILICVGGLSGSGKTSVSRALAPLVGACPGAVHLRSDQIRKALFGVPETQALDPRCYAPEVSERVYETMLKRGASILKAGRSVVLDAVHNRLSDREVAAAMAREQCVPFLGIWLDAPETLLAERVENRRNDASDATPEVVSAQLNQETGPISWARIDASRAPEDVVSDALALISSSGLVGINSIGQESL